MKGYVPKSGFERNPLKRYRNLPCPCRSGRKIKKCHGMSETMTNKEAEMARAYLRELSMHGFIEGRIDFMKPQPNGTK